jgi:hypothetical protein
MRDPQMEAGVVMPKVVTGPIGGVEKDRRTLYPCSPCPTFAGVGGGDGRRDTRRDVERDYCDGNASAAAGHCSTFE